MATVTDGRLFGKSIKRREDPRFITGRGTYVDDVKLPGIKVPTRPALAQGKARYVGEPVAIVIGETAYAAKDGAEAVKVTYEALPAVSNAKKAHETGAPQLFDNIPKNQCFYWTIGD